MPGIKDMVYVARRTFFDLIIVGFVLGLIGVLPDLDHWFAVTRGWANGRFAHNPLVFLVYAFLWGLAATALVVRWNLVGIVLKEQGEIGVRWPSYVWSGRGPLPAELVTVQDPTGARVGGNFSGELYRLPQQTTLRPLTVYRLVRSHE